MRKAHLTNVGIAGAAAEALAGSLATSLSAAGTLTSNATVLSADCNVITTCAANAGVRLPATGWFPGDKIEVVNQGANPMKVYPPSGGTINGDTADDPMILARYAGAIFRYVTAANVVCFVPN